MTIYKGFIFGVLLSIMLSAAPALADNHRFMAVMAWDGDNRITKYLPFDTETEADAHIAAHIGNYPNAFTVVVPTSPEGGPRDYVLDPVAETATYSPIVVPPPTDDERIDSAFPTNDKNTVLLKAFRKLANDHRALSNATNGTSLPMLTLDQVRAWFKSELDALP